MAYGCSNKGNSNEEITNLSNYCRVKCNLLYEFQICLKLGNIKSVLEFVYTCWKNRRNLWPEKQTKMSGKKNEERVNTPEIHQVYSRNRCSCKQCWNSIYCYIMHWFLVVALLDVISQCHESNKVFKWITWEWFRLGTLPQFPCLC